MGTPKITSNFSSLIPRTSDEESLTPSELGHFPLDEKTIASVPSKKMNLKEAQAHFEAAAQKDHVITMIVGRCGEDEDIGELVSMLKEMSRNNLQLAAEALKENRYADVKTFTANVTKAANAACDYEKSVDEKKFESLQQG
jgi:hypothetical protein